MPTELKEELETFENSREALLGSAPNKYVLIRKREIVGTYESESDAINEGYRRWGNVPFLVKHLVPAERPLNFFSGHVNV
jgi:hypothetical protein